MARFLDNKAIVTIGNSIKAKLTLTNKYDKIMDNRLLINIFKNIYILV